MGVRISNLTETTTMADANTLPTDTTSGTRRISWANIKTAIFGAINGLTSKSTPVGADVIAIGDSAASYAGKKVTLAEAGIVKTYITAQASASRVTGVAPDAIGEYRSYLRNANARTYTETNGSPTTAPSSTNGYKLYNGNAFASADTNNEPSKYEIYIGTGKTPIFEFYKNTGRTGLISTGIFPNWAGVNDVGCATGYDPVTGVAFVTIIQNTKQCAPGVDEDGVAVVADIYFDIKC